MIKLNNKNITYVALADSANSIKAPKEIWYADSNNSVKLVYRRKDALIEGEDYEKYHWLCGRNGAYINTEHPLTTLEDAFAIHARYDKTLRNEYNQEQELFGYASGRDGNVTNLFVRAYIFGSNGFNANYYIHKAGAKDWGGADLGVNMDGEATIELKADENNYYVNCDGVNVVKTPLLPLTKETYGNVYLFNLNDNMGRGHFNGDIAYFRITDPTFTIDRVNMFPCKLLKPVPKWLDANGIRRNIGECGMIDLVSGKFYGNVNSVGTFTVENYYERKEWLKGDGTAYIDTDIIVDVPSLYISTSFTKKIGNHTPLFGSRDTFSSNGSQIWYLNSGNLRLDIITNGTNWIGVNSSNLQNINQLIVDCPNKVININGISYSSRVDDLSIKNSSNTFKIYSLEVLNSSDSNNVPYQGSFENFILKDDTHSLNLIPCTLTMDLPASMDANNIARTKGTSGMWDLVSDKFYGNVASNGTFKAVNLAEGVDYEVHQWLRVETGMQNGYYMSLPMSTNFSFTRKYLSDWSNTWYYWTPNYVYYTDSHKLIQIYDSINRTLVDSGDTSTMSIGDTINIISTPDLLLFNGKTINRYNYAASYAQFCIYNTNRQIITSLNSTITVDGIERYIPVKLLKSIPSKYDANGIARQAGECGMYDTVNDKFYGNVASSGTFSVSDDS